jgi:hypothetical protein
MQTRPDTSCAFRTGTSLYLQILEVFQLCARGVQEELDLPGLHRISGDRERIVCNPEMPVRLTLFAISLASILLTHITLSRPLTGRDRISLSEVRELPAVYRKRKAF